MDAVILLTPDQLRSLVKEVINEVLERTQPEASAEPKFLTRDEVCKVLHISKPTLSRYTDKGIIKAQRVGTRILYSTEAVAVACQVIEDTRYKRGK